MRTSIIARSVQPPCRRHVSASRIASRPKSTKWNELPRKPHHGPLGPPRLLLESHQIQLACASARSAGRRWKRRGSAPLDEPDTRPAPFPRLELHLVHGAVDQEEAAP